jgi:CelD/BcsL family acetyltransferase involved in cellulose biosynthesis
VCVLERAGNVVGFLPFQFRTRFHAAIGAGERVGEEMTDYFGLVARADLRLTPQELLRLSRLQHLYFSHLEQSQAGHGLTGAQCDTGLRICVDQGPAAYWSSLEARKAKFMADTERRQKKAERDLGPLRLQLGGTAEDLDTVIARKRQQFNRTGAVDVLEAPWKQQLLHRLLKLSERPCRGVLASLYAGDTWLASHFGIAGVDMLQYWFPVYNSDASQYAPGRLLERFIIDQTPELKVTAIDRGSGDTKSKRELANYSHLFYRGAWFREDVRSLVPRAVYSLSWRLAKQPIKAGEQTA